MLETGMIGCGGEQCRRRHHLQAAEAENQPPHGEKTRQRQFETDQEQQKDDAKLGNAGDVFGVAHRDPDQRRKKLDQRAETERAQQRTGAEITEHRARSRAG